MPELLDLPVFILRMIAGGCDFRSRFNLRSTSKLMKEVVDQSKFFVLYVKLSVPIHRSLRLSVQCGKRDGERIRHKIEMGIEDEDSMEKTAKWMATIFKNAEIEIFSIPESNGTAGDVIKDFSKKVKENLQSPLKARAICCQYYIDLFWIFDKSYVLRLTCYHDDPNFFREYKEILMNLNEVTLRETMDITDEEVLSMKATMFFLKSENFSAEMINQLMDKFIAKGLQNSLFYIGIPDENISRIKIPDGFSNPTKIEGPHDKIDGDKKMKLEVFTGLVSFRINELTQRAPRRNRRRNHRRIAPNNPRD